MLPEDLRQQQFALARHLRDPETQAPPPGIEEGRVRVYRELFFNNIEGLLRNSFPVISATLGSASWKALVRAFFATHRSRTPLFPQIAAEFVSYLEDHAETTGLPAWLPELAHYEWIEQALFTSDAQLPPHDAEGDLLDSIPVLSPSAKPLIYQWPVTEIGPGHVPDVPPAAPTLLLVSRGADHQVSFARLAPLAFSLLVSLRDVQRTGRAHLQALAAETGTDASTVETQGLKLLEQLRALGIVIGTATQLSVG